VTEGPLNTPQDIARSTAIRTLTAIRLAAPIVANRAGFLLMVVVDLAMLGRTYPAEVAHFAMGVSPSIVLMLIGVGLLFGGVVVISQARGEGRLADCGLAWRRSVPYALILGFVAMAILTQAEPLLLLLGQTPELSAQAAPVARIFGIGMPFTFLYFVCGFFLESLKRPGPVLLAVAGANLLNFVLTALLLRAMPEQGAEATAIATNIARGAAGLFLLLHIMRLKDRDLLGVNGSFLAAGWWSGAKQQRRYGYAAGLSQGAETIAFNAMMVFAGWLGDAALAAYASAINLMAMMFMVAVGLAAATAVQVGHAHGARDWAERSAAGWTGAGLIGSVMGVFALILFLTPDNVAAIYTADPAAVERLRPLLLITAAALIADGLQVVLGQSCRAAGDSWIPTWLALMSYIVIMVPAGWVYAFPLGFGERGLFLGILTASVISAAAITLRWSITARRSAL